MKLKSSNGRGKNRKLHAFFNTTNGASTFDLANQRDSNTRRENTKRIANNDKADAKKVKEAQKQLYAMDAIRSARVENDDDDETRWWDSSQASSILKKEDLKILTKVFCVNVTRQDGKKGDPTKDDYEHFLLIRDLNRIEIEKKIEELEDIVYGEEDEDEVNEEDVLGPGDEFIVDEFSSDQDPYPCQLQQQQQQHSNDQSPLNSPPFSLPNSPIGVAIFEEHVGTRSDDSNMSYCFDDNDFFQEIGIESESVANDKSDETSLPPLPQHSSISENEFESGGEFYDFFRPHEDDAKRQSDESNFSDDDLPFRDITREEVQYYLCPGDHIEYWCPLITAGDKRGFRETRVLKVEPESIWGILTLENCEVLPDDHAVTVLSPHSLSETRSLHCPINEFNLVEGSVGNYTPPVIREAENVARIINKNAKKIRIDAESNGLQIPDDLIRNCTGSS